MTHGQQGVRANVRSSLTNVFFCMAEPGEPLACQLKDWAYIELAGKSVHPFTAGSYRAPHNTGRPRHDKASAVLTEETRRTGQALPASR